MLGVWIPLTDPTYRSFKEMSTRGTRVGQEGSGRQGIFITLFRCLTDFIPTYIVTVFSDAKCVGCVSAVVV